MLWQIKITINFGVLLENLVMTSTLHASSIGGCSGDDDITEMWQKHFKGVLQSKQEAQLVLG